MKPTYFVLLLLALGPITQPCQGKSLHNRWGFGLGLHDFHSLPALTLRYIPFDHIGTLFQLGLDTNNMNGATVLGFKVHRNVILEENLNFYIGTGLFYLSERVQGVTFSGLEMDALLGTEIFLPGLPNLGFQFETGLAYRSVSSTIFKTIGNGFLSCGFYYYF